jgi:hypothetical protein
MNSIFKLFIVFNDISFDLFDNLFDIPIGKYLTNIFHFLRIFKYAFIGYLQVY